MKMHNSIRRCVRKSQNNLLTDDWQSCEKKKKSNLTARQNDLREAEIRHTTFSNISWKKMSKVIFSFIFSHIVNDQKNIYYNEKLFQTKSSDKVFVSLVFASLSWNFKRYININAFYCYYLFSSHIKHL